MGFRDDLKALRRAFADLLAHEHDDEDAGFKLASSARLFTRRTKAVVDDKLSFSATLMRAGEVEAANRLLAEVESDVRTEEAALIESVNEVKTAAAVRRERVTRTRLARTLVAATVGVGLMSFSAIGMAVAGWLEDRARQAEVLAAQAEFAGPGQEARRLIEVAGTRISKPRIKIGGVRIDNKLTPAEIRTLNRLTAASDGDGIEQLLLGVLSPELARRVREVLVETTTAAEDAGETVEAVTTDVTKKTKKKAKKAKSETQEPKPEPTEDPSDDPDGGGSGGSGDDDGDSSGSGGTEEDGEGGSLPLLGY